MYEEYYGLKEQPFDLSPNPRFLFVSARHREALLHLRYGLTGRPGLTVLVGEAGTGKTTLIRAAVDASNGKRSSIVHVSNPTLTRSEFFEHLASSFGFCEDAGRSKARFLRELESAICGRGKESKTLAIIVDEAQSAPYEILEEIRLLTNIATPEGRSCAVALVGQPELSERLSESGLRQLKQRVALRCDLAPLDLPETAAYIAARIRVAGGRAEELFSREAVMAIHQRSSGIPRSINVICDNAFVSGLALGRKPIGQDVILEVCDDLVLNGAASNDRKASGLEQAAGPLTAETRPGDMSTPASGGHAWSRRFSFLGGPSK